MFSLPDNGTGLFRVKLTGRAISEDSQSVQLAAEFAWIEFDPDIAWDEREEFYKMSGKIVNTRNVTQTATGDKKGLWTTVVSAAVLIMDWMETKS